MSPLSIYYTIHTIHVNLRCRNMKHQLRATKDENATTVVRKGKECAHLYSMLNSHLLFISSLLCFTMNLLWKNQSFWKRGKPDWVLTNPTLWSIWDIGVTWLICSQCAHFIWVPHYLATLIHQTARCFNWNIVFQPVTNMKRILMSLFFLCSR